MNEVIYEVERNTDSRERMKEYAEMLREKENEVKKAATEE